MAVVQYTPAFENVFEGGLARVEIKDTGGICVIAQYGVWTFASDLTPVQYHVHDNDMGNLHYYAHKDGQVTRHTKMDGMWFEREGITIENDDRYQRFIPALKALHAIAKQTPLPENILKNMPKAYAFFGISEPTE